jgi:hypothetical protein
VHASVDEDGGKGRRHFEKLANIMAVCLDMFGILERTCDYLTSTGLAKQGEEENRKI